jgi:hypothetical protein
MCFPRAEAFAKETVRIVPSGQFLALAGLLIDAEAGSELVAGVSGLPAIYKDDDSKPPS